MPSTYSPDLRIELIANGEQSGTWGTTTNVNLGTIIEDAIAGAVTVSVGSVNVVDGKANYALTALNGAADQARCAYLILTTTTTAPFNVYVPPTASKLYAVHNNSNYIATVYCSTVISNTTAAGTGISIPANRKVLLRSDGTNITEQMDHVVGDFSTGGALTVDNTITTYRNFNVYGDSELDGPVTTLSPLTTTSSAYLNGTTAKTVTISVGIPGVVSCPTASFVNDTAVVLSTTGALPTGLSEGTTYYVVGTNVASVFSGVGSISGTTLTITSVYTGAIGVGTAIAGTNISAGTSVTAIPVGGGTGGVGTYTVNNLQTVASDTIRGSYSGAQTFKLATSMGGTAINTSGTQSGTHTATPVSLANTPPVDCTGNQIATAAFVANSIVDNGVLEAVRAATTQNITLSGLQTIDGVTDLVAGDRVLVKNQLTSTQTPTFYAADSATATFSTASPTLVSVGAGNAPVSGTPVKFTTTGALPVGVSPATTYYVNNVSSSTFQISTSPTLTPLVNVTAAGSGTHTMVVNQSVIKVASAPASNSQIMFTTTGALLTGLSTTQVYFVVNRTATTFSVSLLASGPAITLSGTASGTNLVGLNSSPNNGIYVVNASTWTRAKDANTSAKIAAAQVAVTEGTTNGGRQYATTFEATNSLGSTAMAWNQILVTPETVVTTSKIANADITAEKLDGAQFGSAPIYGVRAWGSFGYISSAVVIKGDGNIASITRASVGQYTVTFTTPMPDANYGVSGSTQVSAGTSNGGQTFGVHSKTASSFGINITDPTNNNYSDPYECGFSVLR